MFKKPTRSPIVAAVAIATILAAWAYAFIHVWLVSQSQLTALEWAVTGLLLAGEIFLLFHSLIYFLNIARVTGHREQPEEHPDLHSYPPIAVAMCSYREPLEVIEANVLCFRSLTYPTAEIYLLDDTRYDLPTDNPTASAQYREQVDDLCRRMGVHLFRHRWRGAKAGLINDFIALLRGVPPEGARIEPSDNPHPTHRPKYLAVFDVDMNPLPDFAESLIARLEADSRLAFVQTPQFYSNTLTNRVARGAALQQAIFYEYICEGKSLQNTMPCCGTNVIFRLEALAEAGGMDEHSVTEDFATSLKLHLLGWRSVYVNRVCAFGMGPQDLEGFFRQQFRWASGMVGLLRTVLREMIRRPQALPVLQWMEYLASVSYYCVAWVWLVIWALPVLSILFNFPSALAKPEVFLVTFAPYFALVMVTFIGTLRRRGYRTAEVMTALAMNTISFPVYLHASACGLLGIKGHFKVTGKQGAWSLSLTRLWPQLTVLTIFVTAFTWGLNQWIYGIKPAGTILPNLFWCAYHGTLIATVLYFNRLHSNLFQAKTGAKKEVSLPANPSASKTPAL